MRSRLAKLLKYEIKHIYPFVFRLLTIPEGEYINVGVVRVTRLEGNLFRVDLDDKHVSNLVDIVMGSYDK